MKKLMKILPVILVVCLVVTNVFASGTTKGTDNKFAIGIPSADAITNTNETPDNNVQKTAKNIWSTVVTIVQILAVAAVVFAGLKYMFSSADQKADIKKSMGILAVGAILVFAATTILQFVTDAANSVITK